MLLSKYKRDATWNSYNGKEIFSQTFNSFSNNFSLCLLYSYTFTKQVPILILWYWRKWSTNLMESMVLLLLSCKVVEDLLMFSQDRHLQWWDWQTLKLMTNFVSVSRWSLPTLMPCRGIQTIVRYVKNIVLTVTLLHSERPKLPWMLFSMFCKILCLSFLCRWAVYGVSTNLQLMCMTYANRMQIWYWPHAPASEMNWSVHFVL